MKLLVVKLADLGDALTATPALRALRQTWPQATIDVLTSPVGREAFEGLDSIDGIFVADKHRFDSPTGLLSPGAWADLLPLLRDLRRQRYDQLLLMHHLTTWFGTAKYMQLAGAINAGCTLGLDNGRGRFLNVRVPDAGFGELHEVDYCLRVADAAGARIPAEPRLEIAVDAEAEQHAEALLGGAGFQPAGGQDARPTRHSVSGGREWIALHPGSGGFSLARRWPAAAFAEVGRTLSEQKDSRLVIVGSEVDGKAAAEVERLLAGGALNLAGKTGVKEAAAVLKRCRLLISNDSGLVHLATAVGTKVVAVFGPSNDLAWGPYPPGEHRVVRVTLPCSPCFYRGTSLGTPEGCPTRDCLALVTPEMVVSAAEELLSRAALPA